MCSVNIDTTSIMIGLWLLASADDVLVAPASAAGGGGDASAAGEDGTAALAAVRTIGSEGKGRRDENLTTQ